MRWVSPVAVLVTAACGVPPNGLKMASAFWDFLGSTSARTDRIMRLLDSELGEQPIPIAYGGGLQYFRRTDGLFSQPVEVAPCTGSQAESGWRCSTAHGVVKPLLEPVPASRAIDVLHADERALLTRFDDHYRHQRPVVIRSTKSQQAWLGKGKKSRMKRQLLSRHGLLTNGGDMNAYAGLSADIVIKAGKGYIPGKLKQYISHYMPAVSGRTISDHFEGEPFSVFHREPKGARKGFVTMTFAELISSPASELVFGKRRANDAKNQEIIWLIGPPRSGTAWHKHPDAWVALAHGRKRWLLYPPNATVPAGSNGPNMYPTFGILDWWDYIRPKLPQTQLPFEVVQLPGDIVYVPDGWHHAVINIDDVVGISYQSVEYGLPSLATESRSVGDNNAKDGSQLGGRLELAEKYPARFDLRYFLAESLRLNGDHRDAINLYEDLFSRDPLNGPVAVGLAEACFALGNVTGAEMVMTTIITRVPISRQLRTMFEKIFGERDNDPFGVGRLKDVLAYESARFNLLKMLPNGQVWATSDPMAGKN